METFLAVIWNPDSELCRLFGLPIRYYSLMWVVGLVAAYLLVKKFYKDRSIKPEVFEPLFLYCFLGILIGARLGHCLFYEPDYYLTSGWHFIEMLLPILFMVHKIFHLNFELRLSSVDNRDEEFGDFLTCF